MRWFANSKTIKEKLLTVYLPLIIISNLIMLLLAYFLFSYEMNRVSSKHAEQTVEVVNRHLDIYLEELERLSLFPYFHSDVMDILRKEEKPASPEERYQEYKFFNDMFNNIMLNPREDLLNVTLYRKDGRQYFNTRVYVSLNIDYDWKASEWYKKTVHANGDAVYTINGDHDGRFTTINHDIFSISRLIISQNGEKLGAILIDANFQGIIDILNAVGLGENSNVILTDANGKIVFSQNKHYLDIVNTISGSERRVNEQGETLFIESKISENTGWKVSVIIPSDEVSNSFSSIRRIVLSMLILFGIVTIIVTVWFSENLSQPIRELHNKMELVEKGFYDVSLSINRQDEIGSLGRTFNKMSFQIKQLIQEVYEYNIRQKEAELNNLKMQIRPHFLYNTLEAIRALADIHDNKDIVEMATSLGSILRYSIKTHQKFVPLEKEIDYIYQYLNIQQIMVGDAIRVEYDIDPSILEYHSIPLLFQPIVENAYQHGLYGKRQGGLIRIVGEKKDDVLHFVILDNGSGISFDRLVEINNALNSPVSNQESGEDKPIVGIGLSNVNQRIKLLFGEPYGLFLENNTEGGTSVHITFPVVEME